MREVTSHHDGHGLTESIKIVADDPGPGGASHRYVCYMQSSSKPTIEELERMLDGPDGKIELLPNGEICVPLSILQFQRGPRNIEGSTPGIVESVLLAIILDRMEAFNAGQYACEENAQVVEHCNAAMDALKARADARAARGVLGTYQK